MLAFCRVSCPKLATNQASHSLPAPCQSMLVQAGKLKTVRLSHLVCFFFVCSGRSVYRDMF